MKENMLALFLDYMIFRRSRTRASGGAVTLGRQRKDQPFHLFFSATFQFRLFQCRSAEVGRDGSYDDLFESQVERQNRIFDPRTPSVGQGCGDSDENKRQRLLQNSPSKIYSLAATPAARGGSG
jgi:hypothetical protein